MIKVLRIINRFNLGGPTYNATFLTAYLSKDFETTLVGGAHEEFEGDSLFIPERYGVKPQLISSLKRSVNYKNDREALKEIRALIRELKPDIVHTHASKAGAIGRLAAYKEKVPVIVHTFHGHVFHSYFGRLKTLVYKNIERRLAKKTDAIIAISEIQKNELVNEHKIAAENKFRVIQLGFDLAIFQENHAEKRIAFRTLHNLDADTVAIGIIGRLTAIKNHDLFLDVINLVAKKSKIKLAVFIIGDGELKNEIASKAKEIETNLQKQIFVFTSWEKNIANILPGLDIVSLTSLNEGTPVSLIEAQAANVPVITTNVGGVADVVMDGHSGCIVNSFDAQIYAVRLLELVDDKELRLKMSQNGWNYVKDKFNYTRLCKDVETLYRELLLKKK